MRDGRRSIAHGVLWRAFPWDRDAPEGGPFSVRSVAPPHLQNYGRFDLHGRPSVLYLAQTPGHAVAEVLRGLKRHPADPHRHLLQPEDLLGAGHPRAIVPVRLPPEVADRVPDFGCGEVLERFGVRADQLCSRDRRVTQAAARRIYDHPDRVPGFFWWSAFHGDWHVLLLFLDRVGLHALEFGEPEIVTLEHAAVREAAEVLGLDV
jgi:RES domain